MNRSLASAAVLCLVVACGPATPAPKPKPAPTPQVTSIGAVVGSSATSDVGPDGGTISSPDGRVSVRVPAGALAAVCQSAEAAEKADAPPMLDRVRDALDTALADVAAYRHELMLRSLRG